MIKRLRQDEGNEAPVSKRQRLSPENIPARLSNIENIHKDAFQPIAAFVGLNDLKNGTCDLLHLKVTSTNLYKRIENEKLLKEVQPTILAGHYTHLLMTAAEPIHAQDDRELSERQQDQLITYTARLRRFMSPQKCSELVDDVLSRDDPESRAHGLRALSWTPGNFTKDEQAKMVGTLYSLLEANRSGREADLSLQALEGFRGQLKNIPNVQPSRAVEQFVEDERQKTARDYEVYKERTTDFLLSPSEIDRNYDRHHDLFTDDDRAVKIAERFNNLNWYSDRAPLIRNAVDYISSRFTTAIDYRDAESKLTQSLQEFDHPSKTSSRELDPRPRTEERSL